MIAVVPSGLFSVVFVDTISGVVVVVNGSDVVVEETSGITVVLVISVVSVIVNPPN